MRNHNSFSPFKNKKGNNYKTSLQRLPFLFFLLTALFFSNPVLSQTTDTIANWDGINVEWTFSGSDGEVVENPEQQGINQSLNCLKIITSE